ncbi:MAG: BspA family leucine-rich repeat surface protein [Bacteroidales bacterium]|nr:BspA family leucine-rich repeat surface protein [Bacteroidales bacterium]
MRHKLLTLFIALLTMLQMAHAQLIIKSRIYRVFSAKDSTTTLMYTPFVPVDDDVESEVYNPTKDASETMRKGTHYLRVDESMREAEPTSLAGLFKGFTLARSIVGLEHLNTTKVTDMSLMFGNCISLKSLDVTSFNLNEVTNMSRMFYACFSLTGLDLPSLEVPKLTDMSAMFVNCKSLSYLDLSSLEAPKLTDMSAMFANCGNLSYVDFSSLKAPKLTDMNNMFAYCSQLTEVGFPTEFVPEGQVDMKEAFKECRRLLQLDFGGMNLSKLKNYASCLEGTSRMASLVLMHCTGYTDEVIEAFVEAVPASALKYVPTLTDNLVQNATPNVVYMEAGEAVCDEYQLDPYRPVQPSLDFTAKKITLLSESFWKRPLNMITLPYAWTLTPEVEAYEPEQISISENTIYFKRSEAKVLEPYKPYLVRVASGAMLGNTMGNTKVHHLRYHSYSFGGNWGLSGSNDRVIHTKADAESARAYRLQANGQWLPVKASDTEPWCYLSGYIYNASNSNTTTYPSALSSHIEGVTSIKHIALSDGDSPEATHIYDLNGRYLGTKREVLGTGVYIINGQKTQVNAR